MLVAWLLLLTGSAMALIPREDIYSDSSSSGAKMSADGTMVGFIAPGANKSRNVFILRLADRLKRQVTFEEKDVFSFEFTGVKDLIIFMQDNDGDENWMLFKKNISEKAPIGETTAISRAPGVAAVLLGNKDRYLLVAMNDVIPEFHNVYKVDLYTNQRTLVFENKRFATQFIYTDNAMNIRLASEQQEDGSYVYYKASPKPNSSVLNSDATQWKEYFRVKSTDAPTTEFIGFDQSNQNVYLKWGADTDLGSLILSPFKTFSQKEDRTLLAFSENYHKPELVIHNQTFAEDIKFLVARRPADSLQIMSISTDLNTWLITYASSEKPNEIFVYRRNGKSVDLLLNYNPKLEGYTLNKQIGFDFVARDGLKIQAYLSLPTNAQLMNAEDVPLANRDLAAKGMIPVYPQKMVVLNHGGPKGRDKYGFTAQTAGLADRGYAVMQVNFRGSTGFGKRVTNAGNGEWSRKMHTDLLDAVDFVVARGIANRSAVAIMGISYGGYATLVGVTFTPDVFACAVDIVGPPNLISLLQSVPAYWKAGRHEFIEMCGGDPDTEDGRRELMARSPFFIADHVKKPLMIMQGATDPRVKQAESDEFVATLKNLSIPVSYLIFSDEGHVFRRNPNLLAQFGHVETFLHNCLGGAYQPFTNGQYNESVIVESDGFA